MINAFDGVEPQVIEVGVDRVFWAGLDSETECFGVELWWSEPIEVPPMPEEEK